MIINSVQKKISIGMEDFREIIVKNGYYVDKTLMLKEIIESNTKVLMFTRPRRFGKTLNQSMIRRFFENEITETGERTDNGYLFDGLNISRCGEEILQHKQQYPVINISMKAAKQPDYGLAYACLIDDIAKEFERHRYVLATDILLPITIKRYESIMNREAEAGEYAKAFAFLSECLAKYHGRNVIILIDEYDVPLENAYFEGFYDEMICFIRSFFESALKTNPYLEKGVITGCLRIGRESIFTGLNNLGIHSVLSTHYSDYFGFTVEEAKEIMDYYNLSDKYPELRDWYDGYLFGEKEIYNPWSILNYIHMAQGKRDYLPRPYWSNTSSNSIVRELVEEADDKTRGELEVLMNGESIEKPIHEEVTYGDIHSSMNNLWNFLFFTGYLRAGKQRLEGESVYMELSIPNKEIKSIYRQSISGWFERKIEKKDRSVLLRALENGDCETAENFICEQLMDTISYFDYAESYYHGFLAGLLTGIGRYQVLSNRESGTGRPDIVMKTQNIRKGRVIILEFKIAGSVGRLDEKCDEALVQIEDNHYAQPFVDEGYPVVQKYGISFYKKECVVKVATDGAEG